MQQHSWVKQIVGNVIRVNSNCPLSTSFNFKFVTLVITPMFPRKKISSSNQQINYKIPN